MFYLETARSIWGKGINLKPLGRLDSRVTLGKHSTAPA
jgi:hypothetical protein